MVVGEGILSTPMLRLKPKKNSAGHLATAELLNLPAIPWTTPGIAQWCSMHIKIILPMSTACNDLSFVIHTVKLCIAMWSMWNNLTPKAYFPMLMHTHTCIPEPAKLEQSIMFFLHFFVFFDPRWKRCRILALFGPFWRPFFFRPSCAWPFPLHPWCHGLCGRRLWKPWPRQTVAWLAFQRPIHKAFRIAFGNGVDNVFDIKLWEKKMMDRASF